jgi:hypothetical protein
VRSIPRRWRVPPIWPNCSRAKGSTRRQSKSSERCLACKGGYLEEHPDTLSSANNLATTLAFQLQYAEAEHLLQATLAMSQRVLGSAHPNTLSFAHSLENVRSDMRAEQPTKGRGNSGKAAARRSSEPAAALPVLSGKALVEAEVKASAAEAELLAMLDLEKASGSSPTSSCASGSKLKGKPQKGQAQGKAKGHRDWHGGSH